MRARNTKIVISLVLVIGAIALLIVTSTTRSGYTTRYYQTTSEFLANAHEYLNTTVRVNGKVVAGSVHQKPISATNAVPVLNFDLGDSLGARVPVTYTGTTIPDAFREGANVVVEGTYTSAGVLKAKQLLVKCPSKYQTEPVNPNAAPQGKA